MKDYIGLPANLFANAELVGADVRLLVPYPVGPGHALIAGDSFHVEAVLYRPADGHRSSRDYRRHLVLTNKRAWSVPVEVDCCELLFCWPGKVKGKS